MLRGLEISRPNQVWGIDITYIRLQDGWMYLVAILDWFSRYVVSWELDQTLEMPFVLRSCGSCAFAGQTRDLEQRSGQPFHQPAYIEKLLAAGVQISMDGKGRARDNIFTERLWRTIKYEEVYLQRLRSSPREARHGMDQYLTFYNQVRPHQSLDYCTPPQVYFQTVVSRSR